LYRVERTLMVRKAGEPASAARPVRVVSLDWISTQDARRLAGWDSRTPGATGPNPDAEPPVPWYLTREDPVHLGGQVRAEGFRPDQRPPAPPDQNVQAPAQQDQQSQQDQQDRNGQPLPAPAPAPAPQDPLRAFADTVVDTLYRSYPSLFVPPLMLRHPRLARLWYGDGRIRTAQFNDRQVREALNQPSLAQSLDDLTTTGVPVILTEDGKVRRGHHTLILRARLTDRRFETTMSERSLRNAVIGTEVSGQGQQASTTLSAGVELGISPRDHDKAPGAGLPRRMGNVSLGGRYAKSDTKATRSTVAVAHDQLTFQNGADLYSYQVELAATFEGHRRPRGWARLASAGLLGAGVFVSKVEERPLFSRGRETVGRVELAVPAAHGSDRYAPTDPPAVGTATGPATEAGTTTATTAATATAASPAPTPAPRHLSSTEADQLLDGTRPTPRGEPSDRSLVRRLLSAPHVVLSTEGGRQRQQLVQDTADRASGTSWHVSAPGAPIRTALRRAMANLSIAGQLGQYLGPFGSRVTGLNGAGPFSTHYLKATIRGELGNVRVASDPKPGSLEATLGNERRVVGSSSTGSRTTLGLQGAAMPLQQAPGEQAVLGSYATALQYAWGKGRSASGTLTRGRNTTLTYAGRMYLVVADAAETVAVRDRWTAAMGAVGTRAGTGISAAAGRFSERLGRGLAPRRAAAALQHIRDAVMFHLPLQDAIETGLAPDGLGTTTPGNLGGGYRLPPFLRRRRFPSHPSGQLDASRAAQQLMGQLEKIGVPSHDREQVLQRLSPDFLRSHLHELTTDGMTLPVRYRAWTRPHHLPVGGSPGQLRFTLTPVTTTVERLRTGYELEDYRTTARDDAKGTSQSRGADVTLSASQRAAGSGVLVANPALQGTAAKQRSSARTETTGSTAMPNIATTQTHAEIVTSYTLTVTMTDVSGELLSPTATAPVGSLNEILPTSLLTPDGDGADGALSEQDIPEPERAVRLLTAAQAQPEAVAKWRRSTDGDTGAPDPDILPFDDRIGSGILAVDMLGASQVRDALTLATARADGFPGDSDLGRRHAGRELAERVRMARHTPLSGLGTAPAQAQQDATTQVGLTAGFREALGAHGSPLPTQASAHLIGQFHTADSRLYARMHRRGARLLAVENKPRMEAMQRHKTSDALEAGIVDNIEGAVSSSPMAGNSNAGVTNPGVTVPIGGANDGTTSKDATDTTLGTHLKVVTDRSMLFAVPVSWLSVAEVDRRFTDSRPMRALGHARRGPRAAEAETTALIWLREDIARDYGLLDDTTFPDEARTAWDDQARAAADLAAAEKNYYDARAKAREAWLDLSADEQTALGDGHPDRATVLPRSVAQAPAVAAWQTAREEVRRWERHTDAAAADHHRLHLAAARLTAHHQGSAAAAVKGLPQEYTAPEWRSEAPEPYTITDATDSAPRTLTSPDGTTVREVHTVPHDGASFFHALLAVSQDRGRLPYLLRTDLADRFAAGAGDPAVTAEAVAAARDRLAWALADNGNEDLLDALALDAADTFTQDELDLAGVELSAAQQAEFDALGRLPQTFWPTPEQRVALAIAALSRPFAAEPPAADTTDRDAGEAAPPERRAGDHGGADLLPALAARVLGTPLTVVTGEGRQQLFVPHGADPAAVDAATDPVLLSEGGFFHATLPAGTAPPVATPLPTATTTTSTTTTSTATAPAKPPTHRSHATAPWLPPADVTGPRYRLDRDGVLTAPDGATYTQGTPAGRGNGFFAALSTALRQAAAQPGPDRQEAARLRHRAGASPAQLMRLNGLPGDPAERDALFTPPAPRPLPGAPAPGKDAREGHLRRHLADAPWGPEADRAVAEWAAAATGTTVTLIEENGTAHTYPGPSADAPVLRLRRRGGDFVPLLPRTPAPAPKDGNPVRKKPAGPDTPPAPPVTGTEVIDPTVTTDTGIITPPDADPEVIDPPVTTDTPVPGLPGVEEAYELNTLSGARPQPDEDTDSETEDGPPAWADPRWLSTVFGPQWSRAPRPRLQETSEALYALVEQAAGGRPPRAGLADLTRGVLHLPRRARVSSQDVLDLGALALEASSDDLESAEGLAGYFIDRQIETRRDALAEETLLRTADRSPAGRDFTGTGRRLPELDSYLTERSGDFARQPAPWRSPYVIVAEESDGGGIEIVTPWRTFVVRDAVEMARIVSYDARRPRGADIVLALPPAFAAPVANMVAGTTARPVWYPLGPAEAATHPTTGDRRLVVHRNPGDDAPGWATPPPPQDRGLTGARDLSSDNDSDSDTESDSGSTSDGDAEFDRLADRAQWERRIDALRPRPLVTRDYRVVDESGTGVLFTEARPRAVGEVRAEDGSDAPALVLPHQDQGAVHAADRPPLHISADRTLALHSAGDDTTGRSRQVYATRAAIERSSARLAATGAGVRLVADPSMSVLLTREDGSTGEPLFRVEPRFLTASGASEHAFTRDFARMVAGAEAAPLSHIAFRGPDGTVATAPVNALHGREVTGTHHVAQALTEVAHGTRPATGVTPDWAARQAGSDPRFTGGVVGAPTPGETYGRALSHTPDNTLRGPLSTAAARTGVNQFAWAEVGEGYLIQSVSTTNDGGAQLFTHNHAKPGDRVGPHAPYHFAQVVLASEDGTHQITLENETHSRTEIPADRLDAIVDDNLDRYDADELGRLAQETDRRAESARRGGAEAADVARLEGFARAARALAGVHEAEQVRWYFAEGDPEHALAQREVDQARTRARDAVRAAAPGTDDKDLWFFRAYSKRPGESAHEVNAALLSEGSPAVSNPLTTVALHGHTPRPHQRTLRFAEQQHTLSDADENLNALALSLARAGLWNRANGLPLPTVTVTGHGNRSRTSGRKRAEAVANALGDRLGRLLRTFQEGTPGPHVTLSDFQLTQDAKRVRRATDPDRGRVVTVDIDDRRHTPAPHPDRHGPLGEPPRPETPTLPRPTSVRAPAAGPGAEEAGSAEPATSPARDGSRTPRRSVATSPDRGVEVPAWVRARIRYAEESVAFERRLAGHLAENERVTEEFRKMARAAWERARQQFPRQLAAFGSENPSMAGSVGTGRPALQQVLRSGNLRELVTFLFQGLSSDLVPDMLGGREDQHPEIEAERPSRRQAEARAELERLAEELNLDDSLSPQEKQAALARATRAHVVRTHPDDVRPPLSLAERRLAVDDQGLTWLPATSVYDLAMSSGIQGQSEDSGGLVATGTAGSTYRFLVHAARMRDQWGIDLDLGLIRAGMIATSLSAGHHSFHEVMRGAQLALDGIPDHDPALDYQDNWGRYWNVHPLTERELRDRVARDGLFPDEHAQALLDTPAPAPAHPPLPATNSAVPFTGPAAGEAASGRPALQSQPGGNPPDLDLPDLDLPDLDLPDLDLPDLDLSDLDLPEAAFPSAPDRLDPDAFGALADFDLTFGLSGEVLPGFAPEDLDMPDADTVTAAPVALDTGGGQPVYAVPVAPPARSLTTLPPLSLVPFAPQGAHPADEAGRGVEQLAHRVAEAALRNRRNRVPLPRIDIAGYGADARGAGSARDRDQAAQAQGDQRAQSARDLFVRHLDHALRTLQARLPAGWTPLGVRDFTITARGRSRVPSRGVTVPPAGRIGPADLGRQATIAVTSPRHAAAVDALDALRRTDRALRPGRLDIDAVARRIWHLAPSVLVDPDMRRDLYTMTGRALAAGRATSLAALTAFHLEEQGLLAADRARYVSAGGTRVPGLNWTGTGTADIDALFVDRLTAGPTGATTTGTPDIAPWPWDVTPYAVLAEGGHDRVVAPLPDGTTQELDADEFAELVAADLARHPLPAGAPIVLAVPSAGDRYLELPRKLADRTGRTVWVHSGLAHRNPDPASPNTIAVLHRDGLPDGSWLPVLPGLAPDPDDDAPAWHHDVVTQPIVSSRTGRQMGRSFHQPAELVGERESYRELDRMSFYVHWDAATNTFSDRAPMPDPGAPEKAYRLAGHGLPGALSLPLASGGSRAAGRDEAAGWLRRRKSLVNLPKDHWLDMVICHSGAPQEGSARDVSQFDGTFPVPFAADPLGDDALSLGQHLANQLRRTTRLSYSSQGVVRFDDGPVRVLATDAQGRTWWWETSRPEPDGADLDRLAEQAGFGAEPSPRVRSELLRVVRALKLVAGPDVVVADDFPALVAGAAAVVDMWFADPDLQQAGPFWPQLLSRVIAAHPLAVGGVDEHVTRQVLTEAARARRASGPALPVSRFVPLPQLRTAAAWLRDTAEVDRAAVA
ncbi:lonely Cys domain-containing protein, partial [Streptomyces sp. rh34]|uniref:lonely Cys domain-containing protein n=1 Tax=Streptomyces sp. rh34 TaxID=2034272 RepID=UPI00117CB1A0